MTAIVPREVPLPSDKEPPEVLTLFLATARLNGGRLRMTWTGRNFLIVGEHGQVGMLRDGRSVYAAVMLRDGGPTPRLTRFRLRSYLAHPNLQATLAIVRMIETGVLTPIATPRTLGPSKVSK